VWIAQRLNEIGIKVNYISSIGDDENEILNQLKLSESRVDFVFITGGLGPTKDDITKKTLAKYFGTELILNQEILSDVKYFFEKRGRELNEINALQAMVPGGCVAIRNTQGTAPGMWFDHNKTIFVSMPGVPYEMKEMMSKLIIPKIISEFELPAIYHKTILTQGIPESSLAELIETWEDNLIHKNIKLAYLPQPGTVRLRLSSFGKNKETLVQNIEEEIENVKPLIQKYIYGFENYGEEQPGIENIVSEMLHSKNQTLSIAESCTGGYVSSLFTAIAGASTIFKGGIVPYENMSKHYLLDVDKELFTTVGSVSKECVMQLAQNVLKKFDSDYSIAISGIAGPGGGTPEKPVGTVWIAVADKEKVLPFKFQFGDNRQRNILMTANTAINMLRKLILNN
jgi:nicotinamide-nucleotide amidase